MTDKLSTDFRANFNTDENSGSADRSGTGKIIQINQDMIRKKLGDLVKGAVEETLNTLLDEEADRLCGAKRYERSEERKDYRCGKRERKLQTKAGTVPLVSVFMIFPFVKMNQSTLRYTIGKGKRPWI